MYSAIPTRRTPNVIHPLMGMGDATSALIGGGISAGVQLATSAASLWLNSIQLSHNADTATTQIVNGLEPLLRQNVNAYKAGPGTCADQASALAAFDTAFQWLQSAKACGQLGYGSAGNRCITDRAPGGQWDWTAMYRTPIATDPRAAGCAAQLAADNPDAAQDSAIQNILNLTSGSSVQTTAGQFDTVGSTGSLVSGSVNIGGTSVPMEYLLMGAAALVLIMVVS